MAVNNQVNVIVKATDKLSGTFDKIEGKFSGLRKTADKLKDAFSGIGIAAGASVSAGLAQGINLETQYKKLQNQTGLTAKEMEGLKTISQDVFQAGLGTDISNVNDTMGFFIRDVGLMGDELESATTGALTLSQTFDKDVNEVARQTTSLMKNFGISASEANGIAFAALQQVGDGYDDLLDSGQEYATQFETAGFNAQEMFNILIQGSQDGAFNIDKVGDAVKEFADLSTDGSKSTQEAFSQLGISYDKYVEDLTSGNTTIKDSMGVVNEKISAIQDPVEKNQIMTALYGEIWKDAGETAILGLSNIQDQLGNTEEKLNQASESIDKNLTSSFRKLQGAVIEGAQPLTDLIIKTAESDEAMEGLKAVVTGVSHTIGFLIEFIKNLGDFLGFFVFQTIEAGKSIIRTFKDIKDGIVEAISASVEFVLGGVESIKLSFSNMKTAASNMMTSIKTTFTEGFSIIYTAAVEKIEAITATVSNAIDKVKSAYNSIKSIGSSVSTAYSNIGANIKTLTGADGTRAVGGTVSAGKTYLVGERGPELFSPSTTGNITANNKLGNSGNNININMGGVTVNNEADENRLARKIKSVLKNELMTDARNFNLGIV